VTVRKCLFLLSIYMAVFVLSVSASASVLMVYPDGSGEYAYIQSAVNTSVDGDTIMLADGTYSGRGNMDISFLGKGIVICSQSGDAGACIIDAQGQENGIAERGFIFENGEDSLSVLKDLTIVNGSTDGPCPACEGAGVFVDHSSPKIVNVICRDNYAANGAGIMIVKGSPIIRNCSFSDNRAIDGGGLMGLDSANVTIENCLISGNICDLRGAGVSAQSGCTLRLINCTISNNHAAMGVGIAAWESNYIIRNSIISFSETGTSVYAYGQSILTFTYSDIYGNEGGDWVEPISNQLGINGNISVNPSYVDTSICNFCLTQNSPCIDTGDPSSPNDPDNSRADMGAFYFHHQVAIDDAAPMPDAFSLSQNYPNPFNASTTIEYTLGRPSDVTIEIYNLLGRLTDKLNFDDKSSGNHSAIWDASEHVSGVYFYRLRAGDYVEMKRMILLK